MLYLLVEAYVHTTTFSEYYKQMNLTIIPRRLWYMLLSPTRHSVFLYIFCMTQLRFSYQVHAQVSKHKPLYPVVHIVALLLKQSSIIRESIALLISYDSRHKIILLLKRAKLKYESGLQIYVASELYWWWL